MFLWPSVISLNSFNVYCMILFNVLNNKFLVVYWTDRALYIYTKQIERYSYRRSKFLLFTFLRKFALLTFGSASHDNILYLNVKNRKKICPRYLNSFKMGRKVYTTLNADTKLYTSAS